MPALAFVDGQGTIDAAFLNHVRTCVNEAIDGTNGSGATPYAPSTPVWLTGAGLRLGGISALMLDSTSICQQQAGGVFNFSGTVDIKSGGTLETDVGATCTFNSGVSFTGNTQYTGSVNSVLGGTWGFYVDAYQVGGATFHVGDSAAGVGHLKVDGTGAGAGSSIIIGTGGLLDVIGGLAIESPATETVFGTIDVKNNGTLLCEAGSTTTLAGTNTLSGATTQTAAYTKSGNGATTTVRTTTVSSATSGFQAEHYDVVLVNPGSTVGMVIALDDASSLPVGICVRFSQAGNPLPYGLAAGTFVVEDHLGNSITASGNNQYGWACDLMTALVSGTVQWVSIGRAAS